MRGTLTNAAKLQVWRTQIGLEEESSCPGCLSVKMYRKKPTTWQVCHVRACSRGGNMELYNVFLMCKVCNDAQATFNLFRYLFMRRNHRGLEKLIDYLESTMRHQYTDLWQECDGQIHLVAERLLVDADVAKTGKLHPRDPVLAWFLERDRQRATKRIEALEHELNRSQHHYDEATRKLKRVQGLPPLQCKPCATPLEYRSIGI